VDDSREVYVSWLRACMMSYILYVGVTGMDHRAYKWVLYVAIWLVIFYIAGRLMDAD